MTTSDPVVAGHPAETILLSAVAGVLGVGLAFGLTRAVEALREVF